MGFVSFRFLDGDDHAELTIDSCNDGQNISGIYAYHEDWTPLKVNSKACRGEGLVYTITLMHDSNLRSTSVKRIIVKAKGAFSLLFRISYINHGYKVVASEYLGLEKQPGPGW